MRIKSARLRDYKRFTDLQITDLPETARLVVMIGPNGSGKSSVLDAFLFKAQNDPSVRNMQMDDARQEYYYKSVEEATQRNTTQMLWNRVDIDFHSGKPASGQWPTAFYIRSPYRNEPEFQVDTIGAVGSASESPRFSRIIDTDTAVSDDYKRLLWKRQTDLDRDAPDSITFGNYRAASLRELQSALVTLFPELALQDFGGATGKGGFRFAKGAVEDFPYKNLSGGEKAAFDLLLDMFVKRDEFTNAVYCIDEPEAHIAVDIQGRLLEALLALLPKDSQLWIATHSAGFVRAASQLSHASDDVTFLDFSDRNFDQPVTLRPASASRTFWQKVYKVALDDLAELVGPDRIVLCEGDRERPREGFDTECYNELFKDAHGDTLFISRGGASQVERSEPLRAIIEAILEGVEVLRLIDRDEMTTTGREGKLIQENDLRILRRRELENYLYDSDVLQTFFGEHGQPQVPESVGSLLPDDPVTGDVKRNSREILDKIRRELPGVMLGSDRREFATVHLVPSLRNTESIYRELESDIFR